MVWNYDNFSRETKAVTLSFDDWLDGIHKTAVNSVQNKQIKGGNIILLWCTIFLILLME